MCFVCVTANVAELARCFRSLCHLGRCPQATEDRYSLCSVTMDHATQPFEGSNSFGDKHNKIGDEKVHCQQPSRWQRVIGMSGSVINLHMDSMQGHEVPFKVRCLAGRKLNTKQAQELWISWMTNATGWSLVSRKLFICLTQSGSC